VLVSVNLIWNIAANVAIEIVRSLLEGDRGRRSGSSVNIWFVLKLVFCNLSFQFSTWSLSGIQSKQ
jgi:hypothetical protein